GYFEGRNVAMEYRWAEGQLDRLPALAADLVRRQVAVIVAIQSAAAPLAAKATTATIPIVFSIGGDEVKLGLVSSLNRPGGNVTGTSFLYNTLAPKRLELLHELVPNATVIGLLVNPKNPASQSETTDVQAAARALGLTISVQNATSNRDIDAAFASFVQHRVDALTFAADSVFSKAPRPTHRAGGAPRSAHDVFFARLHSGRWPDELWWRHDQCLSSGRRLYRPDSQGRKAGESAGSAGGESRVRDQSQDCRDARPHLSAAADRPRRRCDRMSGLISRL